MKAFYSKPIANLVLCFLAICITEVRGCKLVEQTQDRCRSGGHIWLGSGINQGTYKGGTTNTYVIPEHLRELHWFCGYGGRERVAWRGGANRLRVSFQANGVIIWQFLKCRPPAGCQTRNPPQETTDMCRAGGHLWLEGGINKSVVKGTGDDSIEISRHMREMHWWCGRYKERVAWRGGANHLRVYFYNNGRITWEFFTCELPAECNNNHHPSSLRINLEKLTLKSSPTDNVLFGWESLFGKPADEIAVNLESKHCYARSKTREIKERMTLYYHNSPVWLNSFRDEPIKFWLSEEDGGLEGKNDLSQLVIIPREKMAAIRRYLQHDPGAWFELDDTVTVKGQNIFQEHKWFGFLAENLCISVLDIATGPWSGFGCKLAMNLASKKAIGRFQSGNIARLYDAIKTHHDAGTLTKGNFFKAVMTYQFREGLKQGIRKPVQRNMQDEIREWALSQTKLDEELKKIIKKAVEDGIYGLGGNWFQIYQEVSGKLFEFGSWFEELTGMLEFCLSEILPPARDALYHVYFTIRK